jgi:hypothetical protein
VKRGAAYPPASARFHGATFHSLASQSHPSDVVTILCMSRYADFSPLIRLK